MDIFSYIKNNLQVRKITNACLNVESKIMTKFILDLMNVDNNFISKTIFHKGSLDEKLTDTNRCIIISNHPSFFDFVIIKKAFDCYCLTDNVDKELFSQDFYIDKFHIIPYYRDDKDSGKKTQELILKIVNEEKRVLVFPEGKIQNGDEISSFKKGLFHLAYDHKINILSMNILIKSELKDNYVNSVLGFLQIPIEPPEIDLYYNEVISPKDYSTFESFYEKCFDSINNGYKTKK